MNTTTSLKDRTFPITTTAPADTRWVRALARLRATSLDRRLAAGEPAGTDRLLAAHARLILAPQSRRRLADDWAHLLTSARRPIAPRSLRMRVQSIAILTVTHDIDSLVAMIREPIHVNPQGIARARLLLTDGAGPVYNPRRSGELVPALHSAARSLR